ncbi:C1 family peptidase [Caulobacter mirabilis]|uniref:C1 family peptidase n=1 Tax=Caulobacter mirabilis TaxID=69666 RepID=UPI0015596D03|nr:C1 family peptidase [Caulobacter mirabilis]
MGIDLRSLLGPARDQGPRQTCLSFAVSDAHRASRRHGVDFSAECLHLRACAVLDQPLEEAVSPFATARVLENFGQVEEEAWPYGSSAASMNDSPAFKARQAASGFAPLLVRDALQNGQPVVSTLAIGGEFWGVEDQAGLLRARVLPIEACHAVVIIAVCETDEGAVYLLRNSWGKAWGQAGHVWAHADYMQEATLACLTIEELN